LDIAVTSGAAANRWRGVGRQLAAESRVAAARHVIFGMLRLLCVYTRELNASTMV
jgi:hypothetical protein